MSRRGVQGLTAAAWAAIILVQLPGRGIPALASCSHRECQTTECLRTGPNSCMQFEFGQAACVYHNVNQGNGTQNWSGTGSTRVKRRPAMCSAGDYCSSTSGFPQVGNACSGTIDWMHVTTDEQRLECCTVGVEQPLCAACGD